MCPWRALTFTPVWDSQLHPLTFLPPGWSLAISTCPLLSWHAPQDPATCVLFLCMCGSSHCDGMSVEDSSQGLNHVLGLLKYSSSRAVSQPQRRGVLCTSREQNTASTQVLSSHSAASQLQLRRATWCKAAEISGR